jgi:rubrerythrin
MITTFYCPECGYEWDDDPDSFCPCCDNSNISER